MDAYHPDQPRPVYFYFPVPAATFNRASWQRWLFDRLMDVERHEAMEHFAIAEPMAPHPSDLGRCCGHPAGSHDGRYLACYDCEGPDFDPPRVGAKNAHRFDAAIQDHRIDPDLPLVRRGGGHDAPDEASETAIDEAGESAACFAGIGSCYGGGCLHG